jgi:hypothetical protein
MSLSFNACSPPHRWLRKEASLKQTYLSEHIARYVMKKVNFLSHLCGGERVATSSLRE